MMKCPKCGKEMYEVRSASEDKPIIYGCNTTECIREWMRGFSNTMSVHVVGNVIHARYYSEELGRTRYLTHDGNTWTEQTDQKWRVELYDGGELIHTSPDLEQGDSYSLPIPKGDE